MKASNDRWRAALADRMPAELAAEIDVFESEIALRKQNRIEERVFAETRLRRGVYGQRYDNGHRHDGRVERTLDYPSGELTKGPDTVDDTPALMRRLEAVGITTREACGNSVRNVTRLSCKQRENREPDGSGQ